MAKRWVLLLISLFISVSYAETSVQPLPAAQAFVLSASLDDSRQIVFHWEIAPGYFLYSDRVKIAAGVKTQVQPGAAVLPPGQLQQDDLHGKYQVYRESITVPVTTPIATNGQLNWVVHYQGCSEQGFCYAPMTQNLQVDLAKVKAPADLTVYLTGEDRAPTEMSAQDRVTQLLFGQHYVLIVFAFLAIGLLLAFTPCVLPMIPILSSIILGYEKNISMQKAFWLSLSYVLGMALAYTVAGVLVALAGASIQTAMQSPVVIVLFSGLFIILALSLFDCFEIKLPNALHQRVVQWAHGHQGGTYVGVFMMGVLSTLIVSPCVSAPLVGVLAYIAKSGDVILGALALLSLGLGMGIPLLVIGTSAGKLLPKSGAWMHKVKQLFGLMMLVMAIELLSRIVSGVWVLFLWSIFGLVFAVFIWQIKHSKKLWYKVHQGFGLLVVSYAFILMGGAIGGQSDPFYIVRPFSTTLIAAERAPFVVIADMAQLDNALALAKQEKKAVLIDFYADWCVSCVAMDNHVFTQKAVKDALASYVILRADVTQDNEFDRALLKRFNVVAPPTLVMLNAEGERVEQATVVGEVSAQELLARMQRLDQDHAIQLCKAKAKAC